MSRHRIIAFVVAALGVVALPAAEPAAPAATPPATASDNDPQPAVATSPAAQRTAPAADDARTGAQAPAATRAPAAARGNADRIELEATQITGNAELPRVMYVVPWKRPELGELGGRPAKSLLDEVLEPVDRDVFRRQNRYYEALEGRGQPGQQ